MVGLLIVFAVQIVQARLQGLNQVIAGEAQWPFKYQASVYINQGGTGGRAVVGKEFAVAQVIFQLPVFYRGSEETIGPQHGVGEAGLSVYPLAGDPVFIRIEI